MIGTMLGPYRVDRKLGEGGMGEVYRARDTRLDRTVAIKVLAPELAADPHFRERFDREAHAVAALNDPHICALHDVGEEVLSRQSTVDGPETVQFLVMEYLEGETLTKRLEKGPLPIDQVVRVGVEIADALDKAHRAGIVHRDLKPGNIMLTKSGVKLLDFGLAKTGAGSLVGRAFSGPPGAADLKGPPYMTDCVTNAPTVAPLTVQGTFLGTVQYMAPEQLEGKDADARADIFAFGAVVYEMATGKKAFDGNSQASLIAAILEHDPPPIANTQPLTPPALDRIVRTCLAKDPAERWQSASDIARQLTWLADGADDAGRAAVPRPALVSWWSGRAVLSLLAAVAIGAAGVYVALGPRTRPPDAPRFTFTVHAPNGFTLPQGIPAETPVLAVSPDGRSVAFGVSDSSGHNYLAVRRLDEPDARVLRNTENAASPFWSPDSGTIAFFQGRSLKKISAAGERPTSICQIPVSTRERGIGDATGAWNADDTILVAVGGRLHRTTASGGRVDELAVPPAGTMAFSPQFLPDARHFLYFASNEIGGRIEVAQLGGSTSTRLADADAKAMYAAGHVLFVRDGKLQAQPFDVSRLVVTGSPQVITDQVLFQAARNGRAVFSASATGVIAYRQRVEGWTSSRIVRVDRQGAARTPLGDPGDYLHPRLSPDAKMLAVERHSGSDDTGDIWLVQTGTGLLTRLTFSKSGEGHRTQPVWSPDGQHVTFRRDHTLSEVSVDGGEERVLVDDPSIEACNGWTGDGQFLLHTRVGSGTQFDIWAWPRSGRPFALLAGGFNEQNPAMSPDGRWIAYQSDESGDYEIYAQRFPQGGGKHRISTHGGQTARWRRDGRELYYVEGGRRIMSVSVEAGDTLRVGTPAALFDADVDYRAGEVSYDAAPDGNHFIAIVGRVGAETPITILANWLTTVR